MGKSKHLALCALGVAAVVATPAFAGVASVVDASFESDPLGQITTETPTSTGWYMGSGPRAVQRSLLNVMENIDLRPPRAVAKRS